jgi:hypothetical protein
MKTGCAGGSSWWDNPPARHYYSHVASSEASPTKRVMMVCTSIGTVTSRPCPRPGNCGKYTEDCVGSRPSGRDAISALYRLAGIRQRTAANRANRAARPRCGSVALLLFAGR